MLLDVKELRGGYGGGDVVQGVSFQANAGEVVFLAGPNGCGKTTLLRLLLGRLPASGGSIRVDGNPLEALRPRALASLLAYIPQQHTPIFAYTALEVVLMGRASHFSAFESPKAADRDAAFAALERLGAAHLASRSCLSLSGGQRQMVLIARAVCQNAKIFLMDEPAASLDYANQRLLLDTAEALAREGRCVVMSTHSPEHPFAVGNKVLLMREGKAAAFGPPGEVITPQTLEKVYGVEMDVLTVEDRYGRKRTVCLPVRQADSRPWRRC